MIEQERVGERAGDDFVAFYAMGDAAKGSYRCTDCGYGVAISATLPRCPMCGGESWEGAEWSPFGRAANLL